MTREEFTALPVALALGIIWDALKRTGGGIELDNIEAPKPARAPKYDRAIFRKDGVAYASECDAEGLLFWGRRAEESANSGGQYAEKDRKQADELRRWLEWREQNPTAIWTGTRGDEQVTAAAPMAKPRVYPRGPTQTRSITTTPQQVYGEEYEGGDDDLPF